MRILHIMTAYPRFEGDIVSIWIAKLLEGFAKRGHYTSVFTSSYRGLGNQLMGNVHVFRFRCAPSRIEVLTHEMAVPERIKQGLFYKMLIPPYIMSGFIQSFTFPVKHDIIHVHWPVPHVLFGLPMKYRWKNPMLLYIHGGEMNLLNKLPSPLQNLFLFSINKADMITVNSSYTKKLLDAYPIDVPVEVVPLGNPHADDTIFPYRIKSKKTILFVGRLIDVKGVIDLVKAYQIVRKKLSDVELRIVGDGPLRDEILKLSESLNIPITLTGFKTGKALEEEYLNASVFVLPSKPDRFGQTETLGVVTIEALQYGVPVVASNVGGIPDVIKDGKTGLLFEPGNVTQLANKIIQILENPYLAESLVKKGQEHVKNNYFWSRIIERMENIYKTLLTEKKRQFH